MNAKTKKQPPKPDRKKYSAKGNITRVKRKAMLASYERGLKEGKTSEDIVFKLSQKYGKDERQIYRYIARAKAEKTLIPSPAVIDHWNKLIKVAEELERGLRLSMEEYLNLKLGLPTLEWVNGSAEIIFSAERHELYRYLLQHLDAEFKDPTKFSDDLKEFKRLAFDLRVNTFEKFDINKTPDQMFNARRSLEARELRRKLTVIIQRGDLKGVCDKCKNYR
ncbi:MAG: hypothetical protein E3J56_07460 [Candidatus Aminicenantes bacterium]|nr:MAG: hypothetical protein E3J56_07460 [Candidatus Aminicenantes bacterium]